MNPLRITGIFLIAIRGICLFPGLLLAYHDQAAGGNTLDSLLTVLSRTNQQEERIVLYAALSREYLNVNPDSAYELASTALRLSTEKTPAEVLGRLHHYIGNVQVMRDSLEAANQSYLVAKSQYELTGKAGHLATINLLLGNVAYVQDRLVDALRFYLTGLQLAEANQVAGIIGEFNLNIGAIHSQAQNYQEALRFFEKASAEFAAQNDHFNAGITLLSMGANYARLKDYPLAQKFIDSAINVFLHVNDHAYLAEAYLEHADIQIQNGNGNAALDYLFNCFAELEKSGTEYAGPVQVTRCRALVLAGSCCLLLNRLQEAKSYLYRGLIIARANHQVMQAAHACRDLSEIWEKQGNTDSALFYSRLYIEHYSEQLNEENIRSLSFQAARFEYEEQLRAAELLQVQADAAKRRSYLLFSVIIGVLALATLWMWFLFKLGRNRLQKAELERKNLENELEFRNKELTTYVMYQVRSKEFILGISEKLKNVKLIDLPEYQKLVKDIISEMEKDSSTDAWKEFEIRFQRVHTGFYNKLSAAFPDLSPSDLRLCAFLKLNMSTKDIASVTYQTTNSIDVARHRLRTKLGLSKDENLVVFLSKY